MDCVRDTKVDETRKLGVVVSGKFAAIRAPAMHGVSSMNMDIEIWVTRGGV